ncbi:MAG: PfkB family carbohydrate kinase [Verrucomicrobiota bacterium]|jgi:rfaE bifunctional protein kinase chain/domain
MTPERFQSLTSRFPRLKIAIVGDFCLDRYLEIDPGKKETSIETGLPVHNVASTRSQPGAAGTILNNLVALGIGDVFVVGFAGNDGEGFELRRALESRAGVHLDYFLATPARRTFTYTKPMVIEPGKPPVELNRLDLKNWSPTPAEVTRQLAVAVEKVAGQVDAMIVLDQVDIPETGVVTAELLSAIQRVSLARPQMRILADGRRGLRGFPPLTFKMNRAELGRFFQASAEFGQIQAQAAQLARQNQREVFVTLAEEGILGAAPSGEIYHQPALPVRGPIDIVGAGDAVTANLTAALAAAGNLKEAVAMANAAASIVVHQLGTTGTASVAQIQKILF